MGHDIVKKLFLLQWFLAKFLHGNGQGTPIPQGKQTLLFTNSRHLIKPACCISRSLFVSIILFITQYSIFSTEHSGLKAQDTIKRFKTEYIMGDGETLLLEDAEWYFGYNDFLRALPIFKKLYRRYPGTIEYKYYTGICYLYKNDEQEKAIDYLEEVYGQKRNLPDLLYHLGKAYFLNYRFDEAVGYFKLALMSKKTSKEYLKKINRLLENCENGKTIIANYVEGRLEMENIGAPVNTDNSEYVPLVSYDESVMIFTYKGRRSKGGLQNFYGEQDPEGEYYEDIFISYRLGNKWLDPEDIGFKLNTKGHDASIALFPDGQKLFVYKDLKGGDIYVSKLERNTWSAPVRLEGEVNSKHWEGSASISLNGKTLYFSSDRPGGHGGKDLYKATLLDDGTWGKIENMGDVFNTPYNEDAPFIHANGNLLYFSSEGHNSMGGYDIFYSTFENNTWLEPENIGHPVNTPNDDIFYVVSASGERGYFSSSRKGGLGGQDIYVIKPGVFGKKPVLAVIKGIIKYNSRNVQATIRVTNVTTNESYGIYKSNAATGSYLIALPAGYDYKLDFELKGKKLHSENVDVNILNTYIEVEHDLELYARRNPAIDSVNLIQNNLTKKLEEIAIAKEVEAEARQDTTLEKDTVSEEIAKLYLLDEEGEVIMTATQNEEEYFNFGKITLKEDYRFLLDAKENYDLDEIIILFTDEENNERIIISTIITATESEVKFFEEVNLFEVTLPEKSFKVAKVEDDVADKTLEEAKMRAEAVAKAKAEKDARLRAETEAKAKAEEYARLSAEEEAKAKTEKDVRLRAEAEAKAEEYARLRAGEEAKAKAEEDARLRAEAEAKIKTEEDTRLRAEAEAKAKEDARLRAEAEARTRAEKKVQITKEIYYKVQVAAYRHPENYNNDHLTDLGRLDALNINDTMRFTIGTFKTLNEARQFKKIIVKRGTKDAFITAIKDGERKYLYQIPYPKPSGKGVVAGKKRAQKGISGYAAPSGEFVYKVQVAAYRHPENYNNDLLADMGQLQALDVKKITRFTIGTFKTLNEARQFKKIIVRRGTKDAFITAIKDGERKYLYQIPYPEPSGKGVVAGKKRAQKGISGYAAPSGEFVYKVQVAAYRHPENYNNDLLADMGQLQALDVKKITRFTIGTFNTLKEARQFKKKIVNRGIKDAFITAEVNGKRKYLYELKRKTRKKEKRKKEEREKEKRDRKKDENIQKAVAAYQKLLQKYGTQFVEGLVFKVQSAAYRYPENYNSRHLDGLGEIERNKLPDTITRFTIGTFKTLAEADSFKQKVIQRGVGDAFVTADYNGTRVLLQDVIRILKSKDYL